MLLYLVGKVPTKYLFREQSSLTLVVMSYHKYIFWHQRRLDRCFFFCHLPVSTYSQSKRCLLIVVLLANQSARKVILGRFSITRLPLQY